MSSNASRALVGRVRVDRRLREREGLDDGERLGKLQRRDKPRRLHLDLVALLDDEPPLLVEDVRHRRWCRRAAPSSGSLKVVGLVKILRMSSFVPSGVSTQHLAVLVLRRDRRHVLRAQDLALRHDHLARLLVGDRLQHAPPGGVAQLALKCRPRPFSK